MATNKNAVIRYQALDWCFRNPGRKYGIDDLVEACNDALLDIDPGSTGIRKRQVYMDINFMRDSKGYDAPIESFRDGQRTYYRYTDLNFSINSQPLNEQEAQQLKESLITLSRFKGLPQFDWVEEMKIRLEQTFKLKTEENILSFDENQYLKGRERIGELYNAIVNKQVLKINYRPYKAPEDMEVESSPYHLKQYNNRWFLFGLNHETQILNNFALDRIISFNAVDKDYVPNTEFNFNEYFEDIVGVTLPSQPPIKIRLKVDIELWPYIKTKPLHESQTPKETHDDYKIIELTVKPNYELESLLLSFGEKLSVIEPKEFKNIISNRIGEMMKNYLSSKSGLK
jgi:predicted DNA-binding transcriptional regulator YafY